MVIPVTRTMYESYYDRHNVPTRVSIGGGWVFPNALIGKEPSRGSARYTYATPIITNDGETLGDMLFELHAMVSKNGASPVFARPTTVLVL